MQPPSSTPVAPAETPAPKPIVRKASPGSPRRGHPEPAAEKSSPTTSVTVPEPAREVPRPAAAEPTPKPPAIVIQTDTARAEASSGISGTVTDQTGAAVPQATVQLRQLASNSTTNARTDQAGKFKFDGLASGRYELQINSPGFRSLSQQVELQPQEVAAVKSELQVGSAAETVEVTAAAATINTSTSSVVSTRSRPLPSKLPVEMMLTQGKVVLAVDSAGALFFSGNSGKSWKAVKSKWPGKVDDLVTPPEVQQAQKATFQLTTDSGSIWLSRDGRRWYPAPPQH
jgi:phage baseplate assembly protein gpV